MEKQNSKKAAQAEKPLQKNHTHNTDSNITVEFFKTDSIASLVFTIMN